MLILSFIVVVAVLITAAIVFLSRKHQVSRSSLRAEYRNLLNEEVAFFKRLNDVEKERFLGKVLVFLEHTRVEGIGTDVTAKDKVLIAAGAVIPIFNFGDWMYKNLTNVILYPETFNDEFQFEGAGRCILGMVGSGFLNGQMVLSKSALHHAFSNSGKEENTAIHEFIHLLDKADGSIDGIPELLLQNCYILPWIKAIEQEIRRIENGTSDINPYAITNEAEFFAVASEYFFEKPEKFEREHPELYRILEKMFNPSI